MTEPNRYGAELRAAFESTCYRWFLAGGVNLYHGRQEALPHRVWGQHREAFWLTADNPQATLLAGSENARRRDELRHQLADMGLVTCLGVGIDRQGLWPEERGWAVFGATMRDAFELGRRFGQLAVLHVRRHAPVEVLEIPAPESPGA